jgi:hypothetical protein
MFYHLDRFARDLAGTLDYLRRFARRGAEPLAQRPSRRRSGGRDLALEGRGRGADKHQGSKKVERS